MEKLDTLEERLVQLAGTLAAMLKIAAWQRQQCEEAGDEQGAAKWDGKFERLIEALEHLDDVLESVEED